jgi:hypothetical protein
VNCSLLSDYDSEVLKGEKLVTGIVEFDFTPNISILSISQLRHPQNARYKYYYDITDHLPPRHVIIGAASHKIRRFLKAKDIGNLGHLFQSSNESKSAFSTALVFRPKLPVRTCHALKKGKRFRLRSIPLRSSGMFCHDSLAENLSLDPVAK